nr:hypothetical protein [Tanacetum cinerariifolium]
MTHSTVKRLTKPLDEPESEFQRRRKTTLRSHQNESLAIAGRNLFDDEAYSSYNTGAKLPTPLKTLHEHSHPNSYGFQNPITFPTKRTGRIVDSRDIWLIQNTCIFQGLRNEDPIRHIRHYLSIVDNIADGATRDTSRLKKQKKDDKDERLLLIFKQIHINLPFLEAMIHMPKGSKVLNDLLSHKEKLEKATSSVKLSEECSAVIQRSLLQKEGDPGSFTLPCLIGHLSVKNALADLGASINLMPLLEMDEDELVPIILGRPFLAATRAVTNVHEGKSSLRVRSKTVTFNIGKSMKSKHSRDDYLYYADHTGKLV